MIPHAPIDADTATLLDLIGGDPRHEEHRAIVVQAVLETARENDGLVSANAYRLKLTNALGHYTVTPCVVGATVYALRRKGVLRFVDYITTEGSRSGNSGRPTPLYRLVTKDAA